MAQLPKEMKKDIEDAFFMFDYDKDGKITDKEVAAAVRSCGLNPTQSEVKAIENDVKAIGDKVDVNTLCQFITQRIKDLKTTPGELKDAFQVFDKQGNGCIAVHDLRMSLTTLGERLSDEDLDAFIRECDCDGEGMVRADDMIKVLLA